MLRKRVAVCLFFSSTAFFCCAQKTVLHTNYQWVQYFNQFRFSKNVTLLSDVSFRTVDTFSELSQISLRTGLGYPITSSMSAATGIACFTTYGKNSQLGRIEFRP